MQDKTYEKKEIKKTRDKIHNTRLRKTRKQKVYLS